MIHSTFCVVARITVSIMSLLVGVAFMAYGIYVLETPTATATAGGRAMGEPSGLAGERMLAIISVCVGAIMALQSLCIIAIGCFTDRRLEVILNGLKEENDELTASIQTLSAVGERYKQQVEQLEASSVELERTTNALRDQNGEFATQNSTLRVSIEAFRAQNEDYKRNLGEVKVLNSELADEIEHVRLLHKVSDEEITKLQALCAEQREQIERLVVQAKNLNALQRESVRMIQHLAMYGEEAKTLGVSLADVSRELRETDESLGLTKDEMSAQIEALKFITQSLGGLVTPPPLPT